MKSFRCSEWLAASAWITLVFAAGCSGGGSDAPSGGGGAAGAAGGNSGPNGVTHVAVGEGNSCAIVGGSVYCWGSGSTGALGDGSGKGSPTPLKVAGISGAQRVACGDGWSCAMHSTGFSCWGRNANGQLGDGVASHQSCGGSLPIDCSLTPVPVSGVSGGTDLIAAVEGGHACAMTATGSFCWGENDDCAVGSTETDQKTPFPIPGASDARLLAISKDVSCAVLGDKTATCWGKWEVPGVKPGTKFCTPVALTGFTDLTALGVGAGFFCGLDGSGAVRCKGSNEKGQLGDGTLQDSLDAPTTVGVASISKISVGTNHACAVTSAGAVACWGSNEFGQLGDGASHQTCGGADCSPSPVSVPGLTSVAQVAAGSDSTCAVLSDGTLMCWGKNAGAGVSVSTATPAKIAL